MMPPKKFSGLRTMLLQLNDEAAALSRELDAHIAALDNEPKVK